MLDTAQQAVIGWQAVGPLVCSHPDFGVFQPARNRGDDGLRQLVLNIEELLDAAIETLAPQMVAWYGVNQLGGDANPAAHCTDTAFDDVAHAEVTCDAADVKGLVAILKRRVPGNHEQRTGARQFGDDVFSDAIGEILLLRLAAHIGERQDGNRRLVGERQRWSGHFRPCTFGDPEHADRIGDVFQVARPCLRKRPPDGHAIRRAPWPRRRSRPGSPTPPAARRC